MNTADCKDTIELIHQIDRTFSANSFFENSLSICCNCTRSEKNHYISPTKMKQLFILKIDYV